MTTESVTKMPILYVPHGGGPLPLMGDASQEDIAAFLTRIGPSLPKPEAVLVISAHWETDTPTILSVANPTLLYDYYGFPEAAYHYDYPIAGATAQADRLSQLLAVQGIEHAHDNSRGLDHGVFVPLMLMYPAADIPVFQLSMGSHLDPLAHIQLGQALSDLRHQGVLILGSGMSFHNMRDMMAGTSNLQNAAYARDFDHWLVDAVTNESYSSDERKEKLVHWSDAPAARFSHPREEHLLPLHVCAGAAQLTAAHLTFHEPVFGRQVSGYIWRD